jgi:uncharacterized membrane protein YphA (DoxX/SURF4 family)
MIAVVRMATSIFFLFFGQYKVFGSAFAHGGFQEYLRDYIEKSAVGLFRPVLAQLILPHAVFFAYAVGTVELFIGIALLVGRGVRFASALGAFYMLFLTFATWWEPGYNVSWWRYLGNELDHLPLLFLFLIFYMAPAGGRLGLGQRTKLR